MAQAKVTITGDSRDARQAMDRLEDSTSSLDTTISKLGNIAKEAGKFALKAFAAGVAAAGAATVVAAGKFADFEQQMADISTLLNDDVNVRIAEMEEQIKSLAVETGTSTDELTSGLYQVVSAFGDTAESVETLTIANEAAIAGGAELKESVNLLASVTKGYGDTSTETMRKVSDLAFQTVKLGQTTFPELAQTMGRVIPMASTMGAEVESLFGAMATLTGVTGDTAEVSTQLRAIFKALIKPTEDMKAAISEAGYETGEALINSEGFQGSLEALKGTTDGTAEELGNLFSRAEALTGVMALTGQQADDLTEKTEAMQNSTGAATEAFERATSTLDRAFKRIKQIFNVALIDAIDNSEENVKEFTDLIEENQDEIADFLEEVVGGFVDISKSVVEDVIPALEQIAYFVSQVVIPALKEMVEYIGNLPGLWRFKIEFLMENAESVESTKESIKALREEQEELREQEGFLNSREIRTKIELVNRLIGKLQTRLEKFKESTEDQDGEGGGIDPVKLDVEGSRKRFEQYMQEKRQQINEVQSEFNERELEVEFYTKHPEFIGQDVVNKFEKNSKIVENRFEIIGEAAKDASDEVAKAPNRFEEAGIIIDKVSNRFEKAGTESLESIKESSEDTADVVVNRFEETGAMVDNVANRFETAGKDMSVTIDNVANRYEQRTKDIVTSGEEITNTHEKMSRSGKNFETTLENAANTVGNRYEETANKVLFSGQSIGNTFEKMTQSSRNWKEITSNSIYTIMNRFGILEPVAQTALSNMKAWIQDLADETSKAAKNFASSFVNMIDAVTEGRKTFKEAMKDMLISMITMLEKQVLAQQVAGIATAVAQAPATLGASLAAIPGIIAEAAAALAVFETVKAGIRGLAEGGRTLTAGSVLVGESGPELLDLPSGARVTPLDKTNNNKTNININITGNNISSDYDTDRIAGRIIGKLRRAGVVPG